MAVVKLTYQQEELIFNTARKCDFENFEVDADIGTFKGDNYLGVITTITLKEKSSDKTLHLILKSAHTSESFRKEAPIAQAFAREAYMYNTIFRRFLEFQSGIGITDPFRGAAKYYGSCLDDVNESILMENLKQNGYSLWNRKIPMDDQHVTLVFSEYARFHAISLALRYHHPEEFDQLTENLQINIFESESQTKNHESAFNLYFKTGLSGAEGNIKVTRALEKLRENIMTLFLDGKENRDKSHEVVIHGDCWCNNMLFYYKENSTTPLKVCFIDWQITKVGSPVLDLTHFFSVCSGKDIIEQLPKYLRIYHKILANNLKEFNCDPEKVFSFNTLMDHWKRNAWYGVFISMMALKLMLTDSEDAPDIVTSIENGQNVYEALDVNVSKLPEYKRRLCDLVEYMENSTTPLKVCFIVWPLTKVESPVLHLTHFFSVYSGKDIIEQIPKYLRIYHEILANNLKEFKCDPKKVFSFYTLMDHWK